MTDQVVIDWQTLLNVLKDIDIDNSNPFGEKGCSYTVNGNHCLVGEIFTKLGIEMPPINHPDNGQRLIHLVSDGERWSHVKFSDHEILNLLCDAQAVADSDHETTWYEALQHAASANDYVRHIIVSALDQEIFDMKEMRDF